MGAIDNVFEKLKFTYVGCEISTKCTFGSDTFCGNGIIRHFNIVMPQLINIDHNDISILLKYGVHACAGLKINTVQIPTKINLPQI